MRGVIERLVPGEGFGFVRGAHGEEYFLHANALNGTDFEALAEGASVDFSVADRYAGDRPDEHRRAVNLRLAPDELPAVDNEPLPPEKA